MGSALSSPAIRAVRNGDIAEVEKQIRAYRGSDNWRDLRDGKDRNSLLHIAGLHGKPHLVKLLTKQYSFATETRNARNNTPLLEVARASGVESQACFADVVQTLLASGADAKALGENGWTVLHCLAANPNPNLHVPQQREVASLLIQNGAQFNILDNANRLAVDIAVKRGNLPVLCALADAAPQLVSVDAVGVRLLASAAKAEHRQIVQELLRRAGGDGPIMVTRALQTLGNDDESCGLQLQLQLDGALVELELRQAQLRYEEQQALMSQHMAQFAQQQAQQQAPSAPPLYPNAAAAEALQGPKHSLWGPGGSGAAPPAAGVVTGVPVSTLPSAPPLYPQHPQHAMPQAMPPPQPSPHIPYCSAGAAAGSVWLQQEVVRLEVKVAQLQAELREHAHKQQMLEAAQVQAQAQQRQAEAAQRQAAAAELTARLAREQHMRERAEAQKKAQGEHNDEERDDGRGHGHGHGHGYGHGHGRGRGCSHNNERRQPQRRNS